MYATTPSLVESAHEDEACLGVMERSGVSALYVAAGEAGMNGK